MRLSKAGDFLSEIHSERRTNMRVWKKKGNLFLVAGG